MKKIYEPEGPIWIDSLSREIPPELAGKAIGRYFNLSVFPNMLETSELYFYRHQRQSRERNGLKSDFDIIGW